MTKSNFLKQLAKELTEALPTHVSALKKDFERHCHTVLSKAFNKFDLVTREEFDTQTKVLQRSRKKLEELDKQIRELEAMLHTKQKKHKHD
ncbi:MAG: hypothetical protein A3F14_04535 [Gammaproteobacteria bacterium RIFCSPHIGHO2_12_FULL_43_28]|nr:MAG: hypothetical protein A3F14_04535 [Gammaproteobacteria bacterium RIFCSPHIGHO2_12_FULL_43_28]